MPLDKPKLIADLTAMQQRATAEKWEPPRTLQALADAIEAFVRSGDVNVSATVDLADIRTTLQASGKVT